MNLISCDLKEQAFLKTPSEKKEMVVTSNV